MTIFEPKQLHVTSLGSELVAIRGLPRYRTLELEMKQADAQLALSKLRLEAHRENDNRPMYIRELTRYMGYLETKHYAERALHRLVLALLRA